MFVSLAIFALAGIVPVSSVAGGPSWSKDYAEARQQGVSVNKPLIVVIGSGKRGWDQVSRDGGLSKGVLQVLADSYVCVYVDTEDEKGKSLASAFEVQGAGLVISNRDGSVQAFRHEGSLNNEDMERYLRRYADPQFVARSTETFEQYRVSYYYNQLYAAPAAATPCQT